LESWPGGYAACVVFPGTIWLLRQVEDPAKKVRLVEVFAGLKRPPWTCSPLYLIDKT
jgi:hypothetical protein